MNLITDTSREAFKNELNQRNGFFFKCYDNSFLRMGSREKYFVEGNYKELDTVFSTYILTKTNIKIYIVVIEQITYSEGNLFFDACPSDIDDNPREKICFFLPNSFKNEENFTLIKYHEINHIRTKELLKDKYDSLKSFYSELLSDCLLISELENDSLIEYKIKDIKLLLREDHAKDYYKKYLKIIEAIIEKKDYKILSNNILDKALNFEFNQNTIEDLENEIYKIINYNR